VVVIKKCVHRRDSSVKRNISYICKHNFVVYGVKGMHHTTIHTMFLQLAAA